MKIKDYIGQELLDNIKKLTTGDSICIKRSGDHSIVCERINIGHRIKNGEFLFCVTLGGSINIKLSELVNHATIINSPYAKTLFSRKFTSSFIDAIFAATNNLYLIAK